jgi:hypothetical protein
MFGLDWGKTIEAIETIWSWRCTEQHWAARVFENGRKFQEPKPAPATFSSISTEKMHRISLNKIIALHLRLFENQKARTAIDRQKDRQTSPPDR